MNECMDWEVIMKRSERERYTLYLGRQDVKNNVQKTKRWEEGFYVVKG
jgi:hypothetical protein